MPSFRYATVKQFIRMSSSWIVKSSVFCHCASGQNSLGNVLKCNIQKCLITVRLWTVCLFIQGLSAAGCPRVHALPAGPPPQGASVQSQWCISPCVTSRWCQTVHRRGEMLHVSPLNFSQSRQFEVWCVKMCLFLLTLKQTVYRLISTFISSSMSILSSQHIQHSFTFSQHCEHSLHMIHKE